ncbi:MAG TPA: hypothetical protein VFC03_02290, partial [Acidimicrobiales bacterium]|nr:hypothetical protein [Acidimicrobiales bacterium]
MSRSLGTPATGVATTGCGGSGRRHAEAVLAAADGGSDPDPWLVELEHPARATAATRATRANGPRERVDLVHVLASGADLTCGVWHCAECLATFHGRWAAGPPAA